MYASILLAETPVAVLVYLGTFEDDVAEIAASPVAAEVTGVPATLDNAFFLRV